MFNPNQESRKIHAWLNRFEYARLQPKFKYFFRTKREYEEKVRRKQVLLLVFEETEEHVKKIVMQGNKVVKNIN
ncbi:hypothetical protein P8452_47943 [Trifolium repens]|nr:hypothetical protein P8452_47943 [Trifolium repens]